ncbi:MAG: YraN family protein [Thermodesulfobacteriota bacterium]
MKKDAEHIGLGRQGEDLAARYLVKKGFRIIERNYRTRFGEIDLICLGKKTVVFVEVKTRRSEAFGGPGEAVSADKRRRLSRLAQSYLARKGWQDRRARFDVLAVSFEGTEPRIEHLPDAFDLVGG